MITEAFRNAFSIMAERSWDKIAVAVDLHGTVLKPNYGIELAQEFYPGAEECLKYMSTRGDIVMFMYSCTPTNLKNMYNTMFVSKGIHIHTSINDVYKLMDITSSVYQSFSEKPYFNVLLEDKAGFNPETDWEELLKYFKNIKEKPWVQ